MTKDEAKRRILKLKKEVQHQRYVYHVLDSQEISEAALDSLKKELFDLEQQFPEFITVDSPTQRVAGQASNAFEKVEHSSRMLSLNDAFSEDDMNAWMERMKRVEPRGDYSLYAEPKIDGLAIALIYENGVLTVGATRGNGFVGENVTANIKTIESIPLRLQDVPVVEGVETIEVRGEVYMTKKTFEKINKERDKSGEALYMNPRNTAAGSIRQLDPQLVADRDLRFLAYTLVTDVGQKSHAEERELLQQLGFVIDMAGAEVNDVAAVLAYADALEKKRDAIPFQIDGVVARINSNKLYTRLGVVGKAPRGAIAYKFPAEQATTVIEDIQVQIGRTGALTPVAHLRPVQVAGSMVQRATLHNMDEIDRLDVRIGDTVIIEKAGDIIPDIIQSLPKLRTGKEKKFKMPLTCPACDSPVVQKEGEVAYYCSNKNCFGQQKEGLYHFVSKKAFDIDGLGPKIVDQLLDTGLIMSPVDIFHLTCEDLEALERFAETSAKNTITSIEKSRTVALNRLIFGLGIRHVGEQTAVMLAETFGSFDALRSADFKQLEALHDVGPAAAESLVSYFADSQIGAMLDALMKELKVQNPEASTRSHTLDGKTFLFTGSLEAMTRDDAKVLVRENGGKVVSTVTKKLDYLVVGAEPGSKAAKAEELEVPQLTEEAFLRLLK